MAYIFFATNLVSYSLSQNGKRTGSRQTEEEGTRYIRANAQVVPRLHNESSRGSLIRDGQARFHFRPRFRRRRFAKSRMGPRADRAADLRKNNPLLRSSHPRIRTTSVTPPKGIRDVASCGHAAWSPLVLYTYIRTRIIRYIAIRFSTNYTRIYIHIYIKEVYIYKI